MIQIAICDDEPAARAVLADLVRRQPQPCEIREYSSAQALLSDSRRTDLLFLDVRLGGQDPDGMTLARELRARLPEPQPAVIFVSGYDQYVFEAFDAGAFQYLLKPVKPDRFAQVFAWAVSWIEHREASGESSQNAPEGLTLRFRGTCRRVVPDQLYYAESRNHQVTLHLRDGEFTCYARLRDLEAELGPDFCRVHKGYLVNLRHVEGYSRTEVRLSCGSVLPVSKYKYQDFVKACLRFLRKGADL